MFLPALSSALRSGGRRALVLALVGGSTLHAQRAPVAPGRPRAAGPAHALHVPAEWATIQSAIDHARPGDVVVVAPGAYVESIDFHGRAIEVLGVEGPTRTILRPPSPGPVVRFGSGEGPDSRLMGFTIRGGESDYGSFGGGVCCRTYAATANPYLSDCIIESNFSDPIFGYGPGAAGLDGDAILERCIFRGNEAYFEDGGAVRGAVTMLQCLVENNWGCEGGGGLSLKPGALVQDCIIRRNWSGPCGYHGLVYEGPGGGILAPLGPIEIVGCILQDNWVDEYPEAGDPSSCDGFTFGGGLNAGPGVTLRRCTLAGNHVENCALVGGIQGSPTLIDSIVSGNEDAPGFYAAQSSFRFSDVQGGAAGAGSFDADPLFVDPGAGDLSLHDGSPCIDAGDPASAPDADGTRADLGALAHSTAKAPLSAAWHENARLQPADTALSLSFGTSVALDADTALIGATGYGGPDSAYVFRRNGAAWSEEARLTPSAPQTGNGFGSAVAVLGNLAVVGAPNETVGGAQGAVYVFTRSAADAPFVQTLRLLPDAASSASFGAALALDADFLVVGAPGGGLPRAFVFRRGAADEMTQVAVFNAPPYNAGFFGASFGGAVAISGTTIVVGAANFGDNSQALGAAFVYERAGATDYSWVRSAQLAPEGARGIGLFGVSVSISEGTILVGSNAGAYAFERRGPGLSWSRSTRIEPFEHTTALVRDGHAWLTGASGEIRELVQPSAGAAWSEVARFAAPYGPRAFDRGTLLAGAPDEDNPVGAVHVFSRGVQLDSIGVDRAADEEEVVLRGLELDTVTQVLVGGIDQPIVRQSASELAIVPARRDPGFADLALVAPAGTLTLANGLESLPTLRASHGGLGGTLRARLVNGAAGAYQLAWSLDRRATPFVVHTPPTWFALFLALRPGRSGFLDVNAFTSTGVAERSFALPNDASLAGIALHLQAWCRRGLFGPSRYSFTNVVDLTL